MNYNTQGGDYTRLWQRAKINKAGMWDSVRLQYAYNHFQPGSHRPSWLCQRVYWGCLIISLKNKAAEDNLDKKKIIIWKTSCRWLRYNFWLQPGVEAKRAQSVVTDQITRLDTHHQAEMGPWAVFSKTLTCSRLKTVNGVLLLKHNATSLPSQTGKHIKKSHHESVTGPVLKGRGMKVLVGSVSQRSGSQCALRISKIQCVALLTLQWLALYQSGLCVCVGVYALSPAATLNNCNQSAVTYLQSVNPYKI